MTDLTGRRVLIVEDAFYLAMDVARVVQDLGGEVMGPFPDVQEALAALGEATPDCAVLDVNLGDGASFEVARALSERSIPFLFFTGYDQSAIPGEFADATRLEKPVDNARLIRTLCERCGTAQALT